MDEMVEPTTISKDAEFLEAALGATSRKAVVDLIASLPVVPDTEYSFNRDDPESGWRKGCFHWYPVGRDRGNAGRISLAGSPENPIAERVVNGIEAILELERQRELMTKPGTLEPQSPREAVRRYFDLPPLDAVPGWPHPIRGRKPREYGRELARRIRVRLIRNTRPVEYTVTIEDDGIGQAPDRVHETVLSLGSSDKADKPYLIGVFGQGGSSGFAASAFSWMMSRRAPDLLGKSSDGAGWTVIKQVLPPGRRDSYWAYLAAHPDGRVPRLSVDAAEHVGLKHGTRIAHVGYDFGPTEPSRTLYQSLNHLLFNPVLPYELYTRTTGTADPMWGTAYRLSHKRAAEKDLDKVFAPQVVARPRES